MSAEVQAGQPALKKTLTFWWIYAIAVGAVVGDGIFTFAGYGVAAAGPSMVVNYIVGGVAQLFLMLSFGELVVWKPTSGGPEVWVRELVGWDWGATSSMLFSFGWILAGGATGLAIGAYTHNFLLHIGIDLQPVDLWISIIAIAWLTLFAYLNVVGVEVAARIQFYLVVGLVGIMVLYSVLMLPKMSASNFTPFFPSGWMGTFAVFPIACHAFMGASTVLFASEEAKNPVDVSRVLLWSSITFVIVYTTALLGAVGTLSHGEVEKFVESIYVTSALKEYGPLFANVINVAAWIAAATCLLMGTIYQPPRDMYNLARVGYKVPKWMGYIHPTYKTPSKNIWVIWAVSVVFVVMGQIAGQTAIYQLLLYQLVWVWCASWAFTLWAAFNFRKRYPEEAAKLPWKVPLWPFTPIVGGVGIFLCAFAMFQDIYANYGTAMTVGFAVAGIAIVAGLKVMTAHIKPESAR